MKKNSDMLRVEKLNIQKTVGQKTLNVGWWLFNIIIFFLFFYIKSYSNLYSGAGYVEEHIILISLMLIFIIMIIGQIVTKIGIKKVADSKGWAVYFIVIGIFSIVSVIGILFLIGGIISLNEINNINNLSIITKTQSNNLNAAPVQNRNVKKNTNTLSEDLLNLNKLKKENALTEEEYAEAKRKILDSH